jgi:hypothetical protein
MNTKHSSQSPYRPIFILIVVCTCNAFNFFLQEELIQVSRCAFIDNSRHRKCCYDYERRYSKHVSRRYLIIAFRQEQAKCCDSRVVDLHSIGTSSIPDRIPNSQFQIF